MRAKSASIIHEDPTRAGREVADELFAELGEAPDLVLVFASSELDQHAVLDGLWSRLPVETRLLGCSSMAEINQEEAVTGSVTAMGFCFDRVEWETFRLPSVTNDCHEAGRELGQMIEPFGPKLVVVLPDGLSSMTLKFVHGVQDILGAGCPIVGGLASETLRFEHTYQLFDREVFEGGAVALALRGPIEFASATGLGFQPVGVARSCTEVEGDKLIKRLDGESALDLYKAFLGEDVTSRPTVGLEFPLAIIAGAGGDYMGSNEQTMVIRAVRQLDDEAGALLCGGDVYQGAKVRMTRATKDDLITAARNSVERVKRVLPNPALCLLFNCGGRKIVLGGRYRDEIEAAFVALGEDIPRVGFYCYGELAPVNGTNMYHDETFTLALVGVTS